MLSAFLFRAILLLLWVMTSPVFASGKNDMLRDAIRKAYAHQKSKLAAPLVSNIFLAQEQSVNLAKVNREIAKGAAKAYVNLYYARQVAYVRSSQLEFVKGQEKLEQKKLDQGLTTRSNLVSIKAYGQNIERKLLEANRRIQAHEWQYFETIGEAATGRLNLPKLSIDTASHRRLLEQISLSHPQLMRIAYQIKNVRTSYQKYKQNTTVFSGKRYHNKLTTLESAIVEEEAIFEAKLEALSLYVDNLYQDYELLNNQVAVDKIRIKTTANIFDSGLEERKHELKNTPEVMEIFDQAIRSRIDYLTSERQSQLAIIELMTVMGIIVPDKFAFKRKLVWQDANFLSRRQPLIENER